MYVSSNDTVNFSPLPTTLQCPSPQKGFEHIELPAKLTISYEVITKLLRSYKSNINQNPCCCYRLLVCWMQIGWPRLRTFSTLVFQQFEFFCREFRIFDWKINLNVFGNKSPHIACYEGGGGGWLVGLMRYFLACMSLYKNNGGKDAKKKSLTSLRSVSASTIPDMLCVHAVPVLLKIWWWCIHNFPESGTWVQMV